ncbi:MAG: NAD(P)H-dependent oxidoreductase [Methanomicrobiales archaeon]|nr:NAD(P)H-dependent oxidoreductase [Methanomicrobiales archaeon]
MKYLVVYYSWKGHTGKVASALAQKLGAEIVKIEAADNPGFFVRLVKAVFGMKGPIAPVKSSMKDVDHLIVACPVWAHRIPPYVRTYLEQLSDGAGKPFSVLVEMGGTGAEKAIGCARELLERKGMKFVASASTIEREVENNTFGEKIDRFVQEIRGRETA